MRPGRLMHTGANIEVRKIGIGLFLAGCLSVAALGAAGHAPDGSGSTCTTTVSEKEVGFLLAEASAETKRKMALPAFRKQQFESLRELLAIACQSEKDGIADSPGIRDMLKFTELQVIARGYARTMYKSTDGNMFDWITDAQVEAFYGDPRNRSEFEKLLDLAKRVNPTEDEAQIRLDFANISIAADESRQRANELPSDFSERVDFAVRLEQAQFLARQYSEKVLNPKTRAAESEVDSYIAARPQYSTTAKRNLAGTILKRALAGENFAVLARLYSKDPGSRATGGLYTNVALGQFVEEFEKAALALSPGEIARQPVETRFGFHIIKLERKGERPDADGTMKMTFDVRHILISTMIKDPSSPNAREIPVRDFVRTKIEEEREKQAVAKILADNPVTITGEVPANASTVKKPRLRKK